jgi:superfamily I DNA/RNA helicase
MGWMIKYDELDDDQKDFVDKEIGQIGNIWVKGFAGSGKSIMLLHALRRKLQDNPNLEACVVVYTHSLIDMFRKGLRELGIKPLPVMTFYQFIKKKNSYEYVFCDEVQDLPESVLSYIKRKSKYVYVAGDTFQSIYENTVSPDAIENILNARAFQLTKIHRLTRSIVNLVSNLMPDMNIFGSFRDMTKKDVSVRLGEADSKNSEVKYVWTNSSTAASEGYSAVVLLPTHNDISDFTSRLLQLNEKAPWTVKRNSWDKIDYDSLNRHFKGQKLKMEYIGNGYGSLYSAEQNRNVILMTYHSAKGMDFENVFIPFLSQSITISPKNDRTLLMVAITRSKMNLYLTYSGRPHFLVQSFKSACQKIEIGTNPNNINEIDEFDF